MRCAERKRNRHVPDFDCRKAPHGRGEPHVDSATGKPWNHPLGRPYGVRKPKPSGGAQRNITKHGVYYSAKPVVGYKG